MEATSSARAHETNGLSGTRKDHQYDKKRKEFFKQIQCASFDSVVGGLKLSPKDLRDAAGNVWPDENLIKTIKIEIRNCGTNTPNYILKAQYGIMKSELSSHIKKKNEYIKCSHAIFPGCEEIICFETKYSKQQRALLEQRSNDPYLTVDLIRPVGRNQDNTISYIVISKKIGNDVHHSSVGIDATEAGVSPILVGSKKSGKYVAPVQTDSLNALTASVIAQEELEKNMSLDLEFLNDTPMCVTIFFHYENKDMKERPTLQDPTNVEPAAAGVAETDSNTPIFYPKTSKNGEPYLYPKNTLTGFLSDKKKYSSFISKNPGTFQKMLGTSDDDGVDYINSQKKDSPLFVSAGFLSMAIEHYTNLANAFNMETCDEPLKYREIPQEDFYKHLRDDDEESSISKMVSFLDATLSRAVKQSAKFPDAPFPLEKLRAYDGTENPLSYLQNVIDYGTPSFYTAFYA